MQDVRKSFPMSLGAAFGSSIGVALGAAPGGGVLPLLLGGGAGALLGAALAWILVPSPSRGPSPSLSLVVIARDAEEGLPRLVTSVRDYVDEIVVVHRDPMSTDLAQMRTEAARAAKSDWVLVLDADETLEGDPRPLLRDPAIWRLPRRHWTDPDRKAPAAADRGYPDLQARLFPNDPSVGLKAKTAPYPLIHRFEEASSADRRLRGA